MAWQRTMPFGYQMRQGRTVCEDTESATVREIFSRYLQGESLQHIAEALTAEGVRYHQHSTSWNKGMVKRILENEHYLGDDQYPRVISEKDYLAARLLKADKTTYAPCKVNSAIREKAVCGRCGAKMHRAAKNRKTVRWGCENATCGHAAYISDERLVSTVDGLLDELAHTPEVLAARIQQTPTQNGSAQRIANELTNALNRGTESPEYLRALIFVCAAERYNELPDGSLQHKVDKLRERMETSSADESLSRELLETTVRAIRIADADSIILELVNGQIIMEEAADQ